MNASHSLSELDSAIAILRANIRELVEQAAAVSGEANETRASDRIAQQTAELEALLQQRDELLKQGKKN